MKWLFATTVLNLNNSLLPTEAITTDHKDSHAHHRGCRGETWYSAMDHRHKTTQQRQNSLKYYKYPNQEPTQHHHEETMTPFGGIILCGGRSTRMGRDKAGLPFGPETMLQRVVRILQSVVSPVVVVAAANQKLPELPSDVLIAIDQQPEQGPLEGIFAGLLTLQNHTTAAFITSCDVPLLEPAFVQRMCSLLEQHDAVVPADEDHVHPLAGVYRTHMADHVQQLLQAKRFRPLYLIEETNSLQVPTKLMLDVDPALYSLFNLNSPADYHAALQQAGFESKTV